MFVSFTVGNFRSFRQPVTLNMTAARISSRDPELDANALIPIDENVSLLTSAGVYGANASGKSNLVSALNFMRNFVRTSSKESQAEEPIDITPFRLSTATENQPSFFEIIFLLENIPYRYGFEVDRQRVVSEWLFYAPTRKEARLFVREGDDITVGRDFKGASGLKARTRPNALFLSVAAQFNAPLAAKVLGWFRNLRVISGLSDTGYRGFSMEAYIKGSFQEGMLRLIKELDTGIRDIGTETISRDEVAFPSDMPEDIKSLILKNLSDEVVSLTTVHTKFNSDGSLADTAIFEMGDESEGTQKIFALSGPILDCLTNGRVLVVDEMEARLHTLVTRALVGLFNSKETNPQHAQLIFTTHDTNLLSNKLFRRDQIWFVEKDRQGASQLYSLAELKVRNDASFESDYLVGRYGAIPLLGGLREMVLDHPAEPQESCNP